MLASFYVEESIESDTGVASYKVAFPAHVNEYGVAGSNLVGAGDSVWLAISDLMSKVEALNGSDFTVVDFSPELFIMPVVEDDTEAMVKLDNQIEADDPFAGIYFDALTDMYSHQDLNTERAMNKSRF